MLRVLGRHGGALKASSLGTHAGFLRTASASSALRLNIQAHDGDKPPKSIDLNVQGTDTVDSVKSKLQELEGVCLMFHAGRTTRTGSSLIA